MTLQLHSEVTRSQYGRNIPIGRYGKPLEIASAVAYLVSEEASYVTGHIMPVDRGYVTAGQMEI